MKILVISVGYPSKNNPERLVFLQRLVNKFVDLGNECIVISPVRRYRGESRCEAEEIQITEIGNRIPVYFPRYFGFWMDKKASIDPLYTITVRNFIAAVKKIIKKNSIKFNCVYAHFTGFASVCAVSISQMFGVPAFAAAGESKFVSLEGYNKNVTIKALNKLKGIVSVSTYNKQILLQNGILDEDHIIVLPNGADGERFTPKDKLSARSVFGLPPDAFIIAFVGHFIERKGPLRLTEAAKDTDVLLAFAGKGEQKPQGSNITYCGIVSPEQMPLFLNAADVFALPTQNEGCCNAIVEAICCGIPVISSDKPFNYDVLDSSCALLVDPDDISKIHDAILQLRNNPEVYDSLKDGALKRGKSLSLDNRANSILSWMEQHM